MHSGQRNRKEAFCGGREADGEVGRRREGRGEDGSV